MGALRLLGGIGAGLVKSLAKAAAAAVPGGAVAFDVYDSVVQDAKAQRREDQLRNDISEMLRGHANDIRRWVAEVVAKVAGDEDKWVRERVAAYLEVVVDSVQRSERLSRRLDGNPRGGPFPVSDSLELLSILPNRVPQFQKGARPYPGGGRELVEMLGMGGFGEVWLARHPSLERILPVALKFGFGPEAKRLLQHEAAVHDRVGTHPGFVTLRNTHLDCDPPFLEYEYIDGETLASWIRGRCRSGSGLPPQQATGVIARLAEAIAHIHHLDKPVVHRDLKPSNVLVYRGWRGIGLKITDFGIGGLAGRCLAANGTAGTGRGEFLSDAVRGAHTLLYASPQQLRAEAPDTRDDVHALGVIWYQMLTGRLSQGAGPDFADDLRDAGVSDAVITLVGRCVAQKPERRPRDARELQALLQASMRDDDKLQAGFHSPRPQTMSVASASNPGDGEKVRLQPPQTEWDIMVPGKWYRASRNATNTDRHGNWKYVCPTPARIFADLSELYRLQIDREATDEDLMRLADLAELAGLRALDLSWCERVTDAALADVVKLTGLRELRLSSCTTDAALAEVAKLNSLQRLDLLFCDRVTDAGLAEVTRLTGLRELNLHKCNEQFTPAGLAEVAKLTGLQTLILWGVTDAGLTQVAKLTGLRELVLIGYHEQVTGVGLAEVAKLNGLRKLELSGCATDVGLAEVAKLNGLQQLTLCRVTDAGLAEVAKLNGLQILLLNGHNQQVTEAGLAEVAKLSGLRELYLSGGITDGGLAEVAKLNGLQHLSLNHCKRVTDAGLADVAGLTGLRSLFLVCSDRITDAGLAELANLTGLRELFLLSCSQVTDVGLTQLARIASLQCLTLRNSGRVTNAGVEGLKRALPNCSISQ